MSLVATTLAAAVTTSDSVIKVTSATSVSIGRVILIDGELMEVTKGYDGTSTYVPVSRGKDGTNVVAHVSGAYLRHGLASDFSMPGAGALLTYDQHPIREKVTYAASGAITLPSSGRDMVAVLAGTSVLAMTLADPSKDIDNSLLYIIAGGAAAHTVTSASGFGGAGSSYDVWTANGTGTCGFIAMAENGLWVIMGPIGGTLTNTVGAIT
jgi:hypothetical protein